MEPFRRILAIDLPDLLGVSVRIGKDAEARLQINGKLHLPTDSIHMRLDHMGPIAVIWKGTGIETDRPVHILLLVRGRFFDCNYSTSAWSGYTPGDDL